MKKISLFGIIIILFMLSGCDLFNQLDDDDIDDIIDVVDEFIPLDGIDSSLILSTGGAIEGTLTSGEDLSFYFYLPVSIEVVLKVEAEFDSVVTIKDYNTGEVVFDGDDSIFGDDVFAILQLDKGEYEITLSGYDNDAGGTFSVYLDNDYNLGSLTLDNITSGDITSDEIDGYILNIETAGIYSIKSTGDVDLEAMISTVDGTYLCYSDDRMNDDLNFEIFIRLDPGTYVLGVRGFDEDSLGSYDISVEEVEISHPTELVRDIFISDYVIAGERNSYNFTVPSDGYVSFDMYSEFDSYARIYNSAGDMILENDDMDYDFGDDDFYIYDYLEAGEYTLEVSAYDDFECGYFELMYSFYEQSNYDMGEIDLNTYIIDSLPANGTDVFELNITEPVVVDIYSVSNFDLYGSIYDENGYIVAYDDDSNGYGDFLLNDIELQAGTYYVYVDLMDSSDAAYYELHAYTVEAGNDDTNENAYSLELNSVTENTLESGYSDVYSFTINHAGVFTAYLNSVFDSVGYILDENGNYITGNDDADYYTYDFKIETYPLVPGTYYLYVEGYSSIDYGDYVLTNVFDETPETDNIIAPNQIVEGYLYNDGTDSYTLTLNRGGFIKAYLISDFDSVGSITEAGLQILSNDDPINGTDNDFVLQGIFLEPGVYEIHIAGFTSGEYGSYQLALEVVYGDMMHYTTVDNNSDTTGTLEQGDYIWYRFDLDTASSVLINLDSEFDSYGYILDEFGYYVAQDDDSYGNSDFQISWYLEPGTYYVVVSGFTTLDSGDYTLHIESY